ncbi:MAG: QueT transporter family protein [bacterium]|nr:QueT transporter family protein [bacterium]
MTYLVGVVALAGAWTMTWYLTVVRLRGENPNLLIAPLPPVVLNAFGVSLYLAPLFDLDYWFVVQMIGIGQLIACYVLGLPMLRLLLKRKSLFA